MTALLDVYPISIPKNQAIEKSIIDFLSSYQPYADSLIIHIGDLDNGHHQPNSHIIATIQTTVTVKHGIKHGKGCRSYTLKIGNDICLTEGVDGSYLLDIPQSALADYGIGDCDEITNTLYDMIFIDDVLGLNADTESSQDAIYEVKNELYNRAITDARQFIHETIYIFQDIAESVGNQ